MKQALLASALVASMAITACGGGDGNGFEAILALFTTQNLDAGGL